MVSRLNGKSSDINVKAEVKATWAEDVTSQLKEVFANIEGLNTRLTAMVNRTTYVDPTEPEGEDSTGLEGDAPLMQRVNNTLERIHNEVRALDRNVTSLEKIL